MQATYVRSPVAQLDVYGTEKDHQAMPASISGHDLQVVYELMPASISGHDLQVVYELILPFMRNLAGKTAANNHPSQLMRPIHILQTRLQKFPFLQSATNWPATCKQICQQMINS